MQLVVRNAAPRHASQVNAGERRLVHPSLRGRHPPTRTLDVEEADHVLDGDGLDWQWPSGASTLRVGNVPSRGDETEEAAVTAEHRFDGVVCEVMEGEKPGISSLLPLPGGCAVGAVAAKNDITVSVLRDANHQVGHGSPWSCARRRRSPGVDGIQPSITSAAFTP